jgi:hypothetical protein
MLNASGRMRAGSRIPGQQLSLSVIISSTFLSEEDPSLGIHAALRRKMFKDYDKFSLPDAYNQTLPVDVSFGVAIISYHVVSESLHVSYEHLMHDVCVTIIVFVAIMTP